MTTQYPKNSPYYDTEVADNTYLDVMAYRPIPTLPTDVQTTIPPQYEYRPDLLAYQVYGDAGLWWVFAARNPNKLGNDPLFDFKAGLMIYYPKIETIREALGI
jgi:hypothetical protein